MATDANGALLKVNADGSGRGMPGARWFPGSRVNYAAQALVPGGVDDGAAR